MSVTTPRSAEVDQTIEFISKIRERVATVVVGQDVVVERMLIALFTGGHLLLQGVPGLAKTLLVSVLSKSIDLDFARIQFTIDLLPSDILGSRNPGSKNQRIQNPHRAYLHQLVAGRRDQPCSSQGSGCTA